MANIEPNRKWIIPDDSYKYKYKIFKGIHPVLGRFYAHFNPGLLWRLRKDDYDWVVIGGMGSPTHCLVPFFVLKGKIQIMSIESNLYSVNRKSGIGAKIKKILLSKVDAYQVTGNPQIELIKYFYEDAKNKPFIKLPNLIDESVFKYQVSYLKKTKDEIRKNLNVDSNLQIWILPAQLIKLKGITPFLNLIENVDGIKLFLLGDGYLRETIKKQITERNLPVELVGFIQQDQIVNFYAVADLFVLPSLKDPSPLSPIEAIAAGLPILVSSRIGNLEDVLEEGVNGWSYDPEKETKKGEKLVKMISELTRDELISIGKKSLNQYDRIFDTESCIINYAKALNAL
jgi:glycosyltransferase involved in cell wall biosynthesis